MHPFPIGSIVRVPKATCCQHQFFVAQQNTRHPYKDRSQLQQQVFCFSSDCQGIVYVDGQTAELASEDQLRGFIRSAVLEAKESLNSMARQAAPHAKIDPPSLRSKVVEAVKQIERIDKTAKAHAAVLAAVAKTEA